MVHFSTDGIDDMGEPRPFTGTGFVVSDERYIITASHVIPLVCSKGDPEREETIQHSHCLPVGKTKLRIGTIKSENFLGATVYQDFTIQP